MGKVLVYAFSHQNKQNVSSKIANQLKSTDLFILDTTDNETGLDNAMRPLRVIEKNKYEYIIGVGVYSSRKEVVKFEKLAKNKLSSMNGFIHIPNNVTKAALYKNFIQSVVNNLRQTLIVTIEVVLYPHTQPNPFSSQTLSHLHPHQSFRLSWVS